MTEEKSYQEIRKDFYNKYLKYIVPTISYYEKIRKLYLLFSVLFSSFLIFSGIMLIIFMIKINFKELNIEPRLVIFPIYLIIFGVAIYGILRGSLETTIKMKVMSTICVCFPKLQWKQKNAQSIAINKFPINFKTENYKKSNIIPDFHRMFFDDCFDGAHKGVNFYIEECKAKIQVTGTKEENTVFKGVIITLDMNKNFNGNTVIRPDGMFHLSPAKNLHHTVLEDFEFEKKFDVFTDDDVEARYLITPSLMERLKSMQVAFKADKISASFYQNKFYIALHTNKNLFSVGSLIRPVCDKEQFFTMFEEILSIIKLIDHFKLDQKIGM